LTAAQLRDKIASIEPAPGGGSVSIVTSTLAIAAIQKAVAVSLKNSGADLVRHQSLLDLSSAASELMASLSEFADADSRAFQCYLNSFTLPRTTEDERAFRLAAKEAGLVRASQIPLNAAAEMARGLEFAEAAAMLVDPNVRSEVLTGDVLLRASIKSVLLSVDANLPGISDGAARDGLKLKRKKIESASNPPRKPALR
jgi:formiminotetrahydrofolate cyclodeaminase